MQLLAASPKSFSSLRRLHIDDRDESIEDGLELTFVPLAQLPALSDCRFSLRSLKPSSSSVLMSAFESMQSLTSLDMRETTNACSQLLELLCAESNTPLLLRLKSLQLSPCNASENGRIDQPHNALLRRLSSLTAPPALQQFTGVPFVRHHAAGLLSVLSLPHLTQLELTGYVRCGELSACGSSFTSASAPLVSLTFPGLLGEPNADGVYLTATPEDAEASCSAVRTLLSRFTELRGLRCDAHLVRGAVALPHSTADSGTSGCSGSLYSLSVWHTHLAVFPFAAPLSFPQLTELVLDMEVTDAELELLLSACPRLLRLDCRRSRGWNAVLIAARCCVDLLQLTVHFADPPAADDAAISAPPPAASPFLPQLITLCLVHQHPVSSSFSALQHFTDPPHAQLRHVFLSGDGLRSQHVLSLACLPRLCHLVGKTYGWCSGDFAEVEEAYQRTQQILSSGAADSAVYHAVEPAPRREDGEGSLGERPLGPHQQLEMRQRVMQAAARPWWTKNLLASAAGADSDTVRTVFFAQLWSAVTASGAAAAESQVAGHEGETAAAAAAAL